MRVMAERTRPVVLELELGDLLHWSAELRGIEGIVLEVLSDLDPDMPHAVALDRAHYRVAALATAFDRIAHDDPRRPA